MKDVSEHDPDKDGVDYSSHQEFYDYYAKESESENTLKRFYSIRDLVFSILPDAKTSSLEVADIGCGAGTQSLIWAKLGHKVSGIDVNEPLIDLARDRAKKYDYDVEFQIGSAEKLPWPDASMDICLVPELLEHVQHWEACLDQFARILRPGGVLFLSTNNKLCPIQQEFNLPLYSWYPGPLKRHFERLAVTTKPQIANYAKYPAVNWFSFYGLNSELKDRGLKSMDRFDVMDTHRQTVPIKFIVSLIRAVPPIRFLSHVATPYTQLLAKKSS